MSAPVNTSSSSLYSQGYGNTSSASFPGNAIKASRAPASSDIRGPQGFYSVGQLWVDTSSGSSFQLVNITSVAGAVAASWTSLGGGASSFSQLSGNSGTAFPSGGNINVIGGDGVVTSGSGDTLTISLTGGGQAVDSVIPQTGNSPVLPASNGSMTISAATVAAGTSPIRTNGTGANTLAIQAQISQAVAASSPTKVGLSNFNSGDFTVDANGFVSLVGGSAITSGTFSPTLAFGGGSTGLTYLVQHGNYIVIGTPGTGNALVIATGLVQINTVGSSTGEATIGGLPYSGTAFQTFGTVDLSESITPSSGYSAVVSRLSSGNTDLELFQQPVNPNGTSEFLTDTSFVSTSAIGFTISYQA